MKPRTLGNFGDFVRRRPLAWLIIEKMGNLFTLSGDLSANALAALDNWENFLRISGSRPGSRGLKTAWTSKMLPLSPP